MPEIKCYFANPNIGRVDKSWTLLIAGTNPQRAVATVEEYDELETAINEVHTLPGEYTSIGLTETSGNIPKVVAHRGITSGFDVYFLQNEDGTVVLSDHFRNAISELPINSRTAISTAGVNQLFYGTFPVDAPIQEVGYLENGETLIWESNSSPTTNITEELETGPVRDVQTAIDDLDSVLDNLCDTSQTTGSVTTMLSGGVDSTLLHSYLPRGTPTASAAFDSPEFQMEVDYAQAASDQLGTRHQLIEVDESKYLERLERVVDLSGLPVRHLQSTLIDAVFERSDYDTYINGQYADALYGLALVKWAKMAWHVRHLSRLIPPVHRYSQKLKKTAKQLSYPVDHPDGLALNFAMHSDSKRIEKILGEDQVTARKLGQLSYILDRTGGEINSKRLDKHLHYGHLNDIFHDHTINQWRHLAHGNNVQLLTPFAGVKPLEIALSVPVGNRYYDGLENKHILKNLLEQRLPTYDTNKRKGSGALPRKRYINSGPLSDIWERYDLPEWLPEGRERLITEHDDHVTWYAISYAIWQKRVLYNDALSKLDHTERVEY